MATGQGKVSFSFSKINIKKPSLNVQPKEIVKKIDKIQYIESIEDNSVKVIGAEEVEIKEPLVIPLKHPNLLLQSVIDTVQARKQIAVDDEEIALEESKNVEAKLKENGFESDKCEKKQETLEEMATRELLEDATQKQKEKSSSTLTVPLALQANNDVESSMDDYENVPISDFGLAMLRGMGWDPKKGIGKNGKVITVEGPTLRPKGLGLGADKAIATQNPVGKNVSEKEVLNKGSKVRITFGQYKNLYGTVEGFNDDAGRADIHMAISGERVSINECFLQLVTSDEFSKYSKVININAYNNYKERQDVKSSESNNPRKSESHSSSRRSNSSDRGGKKHHKETKPYLDSHSSKPKKTYKYDSESECNDKKYKQSRKHNKYDSLSECDDKKHKQSRKHNKYDSESECDDKKYKQSKKHNKYDSESECDDKKHKQSRKHNKYDSESESDDKKYKQSRKHSKESRRKDSSSDSDHYNDRHSSKSKKEKKHKRKHSRRDSSSEGKHSRYREDSRRDRRHK